MPAGYTTPITRLRMTAQPPFTPDDGATLVRSGLWACYANPKFPYASSQIFLSRPFI